MSVSLAQLSCEQCTRRKTKCSKTSPCSACEKAGINCTAVQRQRLPRGKSGKHRADVTARHALRERVEHLESLVAKLQQPERHGRDLRRSDTGARERSDLSHTQETPMQSFVAADFWTHLSSAVTGLKEVLEHPDALEDADEYGDEDIVSRSVRTLNMPEGISEPHCLLFENTNSTTAGIDLSPVLKDRLLQVYKERVDCLFKPLHWPSTLSLIQQEGLEHQMDTHKPEVHALECALYFTSACTLFDYELDERQSTVEKLRHECENTLVLAGLLTTTSLTLLQAFVIYLAGVRACQANAQQWTLTAIAVRLANAQGIPSSFAVEGQSMHVEVRRRLWQCIGVLDLQSAFDRGSQPLIGSEDLKSLPINVDDGEVGATPAALGDLATHWHWTDMSLSTIIYQAGICQRRLTELGISAAKHGHDQSATRREQWRVLFEFETDVNQLSTVCSSSLSTLQKYAMAVAEESLVAMRLLIHRPLHRCGRGFANADVVQHDDFNILETATEVLERSRMKRTQFEFGPWAWFQWVKWYALAVVLVELCATPNGPLADRAWRVAQLSFENYAKDVADSRKGLLWRPIQRLMRKARQTREVQGALSHTATTARTTGRSCGSQDSATDRTDIHGHFDYMQDPAHGTDGWGNDGLVRDENGLVFDEMRTSDDSWVHWDLLLSDVDNPGSFDWWSDP